MSDDTNPIASSSGIAHSSEAEPILHQMEVIVPSEEVILSRKQNLLVLLKRLLPNASFNLLIAIYDIITNIEVYPYLGNDSVAAAPIVTTFTALVMGISTNQARSLGLHVAEVLAEFKKNEGEQEESNCLNLVGSGYRANLLSASLIAVPMGISLFFADDVFRMIGVSSDIADIVEQCLHPLIIACPFKMYFSASQQLVLLTGKTKTLASFNVFYVMLLMLFGYSLSLYTNLGMSGMSFGVLAASGISTSLFISYLLLHPDFKKYRLFSFSAKEFKPFLGLVFKMLKLGLPIAAAQSSDNINWMLISLSLSRYSRQAAIAAQPAIQLSGLVVFFGRGISSAASTLVKELWLGESHITSVNNVRRCGRTTLLLTGTMALSAALVFLTIPRPLTQLFFDQGIDAQTLKMSETMLVTVASGLPFDVTRITGTDLLSGRKSLYTMPISSLLLMTVLGLTVSELLVTMVDFNPDWFFVIRTCMVMITAFLALAVWLVQGERQPLKSCTNSILSGVKATTEKAKSLMTFCSAGFFHPNNVINSEQVLNERDLESFLSI